MLSIVMDVLVEMRKEGRGGACGLAAALISVKLDHAPGPTIFTARYLTK